MGFVRFLLLLFSSYPMLFILNILLYEFIWNNTLSIATLKTVHKRYSLMVIILYEILLVWDACDALRPDGEAVWPVNATYAD